LPDGLILAAWFLVLFLELPAHEKSQTAINGTLKAYFAKTVISAP
jgi:hypothetical protein